MADFKQQFGKRMKELRMARNLTQEGLADLLRVGIDTIKNYEKGRYGPEFSRLPDIAKALRVKTRDLFEF